MIKLTEKNISILAETDAIAHPAYAKEDTSYNKTAKKLTIRQKEVTGKDWRLVHDGEKVISLIKGHGITYTLEKCVEFATEELALAKIAKLGLIFEEVKDAELKSC